MISTVIAVLIGSSTVSTPLSNELSLQARLGFPNRDVGIYFIPGNDGGKWVFSVGSESKSDVRSVPFGSVLAVYSRLGDSWVRFEGICDPERSKPSDIKPEVIQALLKDKRMKKLTSPPFIIGLQPQGSRLLVGVGALPLKVDGEVVVVADALNGTVREVDHH